LGAEGFLEGWRIGSDLSIPLWSTHFLETMKDLAEHIPKLFRGRLPLHNGVAEPNKMLGNTRGVSLNQHAEALEGGILLIVVLDLP